MAVGLRCGSTTIKYLLFFFNFLFVLCGLSITILGGLALNTTAKNGNGLDNSLIFMTVVGGFIFVVAFFGCCGAVKESHCMLITFACLLMTIIVLEVVAAILVFVNAGGLEQSVQKVFEEARNGNEDLKHFTDAVQKSLNCCGTTGAAFYTEKGGQIPGSCCSKDDSMTCNAGNESNTAMAKQGCKQLLADTLKVFGKAVGAVAIAVAVVEVLGVWFALALAGEIKKLSR